jgi:hypothetical protein
VPRDDEWSDNYLLNFFPGVAREDLRPADLDFGMRDRPPGVYERVDDGWWGIPSRDQDQMAVETQGPIADRASEHLASSDRGVLLLRDLVQEAIADVRQGRDPIGVLRDVEDNAYLAFEAQMDEIGVLA